MNSFQIIRAIILCTASTRTSKGKILFNDEIFPKGTTLLSTPSHSHFSSYIPMVETCFCKQHTDLNITFGIRHDYTGFFAIISSKDLSWLISGIVTGLANGLTNLGDYCQ